MLLPARFCGFTEVPCLLLQDVEERLRTLQDLNGEEEHRSIMCTEQIVVRYCVCVCVSVSTTVLFFNKSSFRWEGLGAGG